MPQGQQQVDLYVKPTISVHSRQQVDVWTLSNTELFLTLGASPYKLPWCFLIRKSCQSNGCLLHPCWLIFVPSCSFRYGCEISHCHRADENGQD